MTRKSTIYRAIWSFPRDASKKTLDEKNTLGDYSLVSKSLTNKSKDERPLNFDADTNASFPDMCDMGYVDQYEPLRLAQIYDEVELIVSGVMKYDDIVFSNPDYSDLIQCNYEFMPAKHRASRDLSKMSDEEYVGFSFISHGLGDSSDGQGPEDYDLDDCESNIIDESTLSSDYGLEREVELQHSSTDDTGAENSEDARCHEQESDVLTLPQNESDSNASPTSKQSLIKASQEESRTMANSANEKTKSDSNQGKQRYFVEERMFGRGFSAEQSMEYTFTEFLAFYFGIKVEGDYSSRFDYAQYKIEKREQLSSQIPSDHLLRRILYDNANLNARFIEDHSDGNLWELWQNYYIDIHGYDSDAELEKRFKDYVAYLKDCFSNKDDQDNGNTAFKRFYTVVDILRSNTLEYSSDKRWSSKILFPFSRSCLFYDSDVYNKDKGPTQERLSLDTRFYRGQGHTLLAMLALSSSSEIKKQISDKLSELFEEQETVFATAVKCISGESLLYDSALDSNEDGDKRGKTILYEGMQNKTMSYFPYSVRDSCQELFDSMAEDFLNVLSLQISLSKKVRTLTILSSLYIYSYLLKRCACSIKSVHNKLPDPFIPLVFGNCDLKHYSKDVYQSYEEIISRAVKCEVIYGLKKDAEEKNLHSLHEYIDSPKTEFKNIKDAIDSFNAPLQKVLYSSDSKSFKENEKDLESLVDGCKTFEKILDKCTAALKKRRRLSAIVSDAMISKTAKSIGLVTTGSSSFFHYAITDELLEVLVLACCKDRYIQNSEFFDKLFKRFRMAVSTKSYEDLIKSDSQVSNVDMNKVKQNEQLLQSRLEKMGLCKALSDASFYYVFNPYVASN